MGIFRRLGCLIFCVALCVCLMPNVVVHASKTFEVAIEDEDGADLPTKCTVVFENVDYTSCNNYNKPQRIHFTQEQAGWWDEIKDTIENGYDAYAYNIYVGYFETNTAYVDGEVYSATITVPLPEGYTGATAKRLLLYDYVSTDKTVLPVTSYTDKTITYPVKMKCEAYDHDTDGVNEYRFSCESFVELSKPKDISTVKDKAKLSSDKMEFTGNALTPDVTIEGLTKDKDFTVSYKNNIEIGTATVTVTGIGAYTGAFDLTFTIEKTYKDEEVSDQESGADYEVNTEADGTTIATYKKSTNKKAKKISIPSEIKLPNGTTAKVTRIGAKAFKGSKAEQITIPSTVKKIDAKAFAGSSAKKIILKTDKKPNLSIGKGAFKNMKSKNITIQIKGCKGKEKSKLKKNIQKQSAKGTKVK
ncbi:leucine-rich repeat protein [Butyrivibrio sp. AD3002]|uniref:leucine-rich repeat protein n=1 Tax=Butyrivibrio sp. AD3002 TaxID=1280670 RepID=UPI0009DB7F61|nr:leucine-rich repeat protein [Butyrivibrio sp. AD3002]